MGVAVSVSGAIVASAGMAAVLKVVTKVTRVFKMVTKVTVRDGTSVITVCVDEDSNGECCLNLPLEGAKGCPWGNPKKGFW